MKNIFMVILFIYTANNVFASNTKVLFYQNDSIYIANQDFTILKSLSSKSNAILSKDGKKMFFTITKNWNTRFCTYDIESNKIFKSQLFEDKNCFENLMWAGSSDQIVYITYDRDEQGVVNRVIEGYDFNKKELFKININHLPALSSLCTWYSNPTTIFICDDSNLFMLDSLGNIEGAIDFVEMFSHDPNYIKPSRKSEDTLYFTSDLSLIYPPQIKDVYYLIDDDIFVLSAETVPSHQKFSIGSRALFSYDIKNESLSKLTPDSITVENINVLSKNSVIFNGYSLKDIHFVQKDSASHHYFTNGKEWHYIIKKHIYEVDLETKKIKLRMKNALLSKGIK